MIYPHELLDYYVTNKCMEDGFGSQYHHIIAYLIVCFHFGLNFAYSPITKVEHNYDNDPEFIENLENLMNIRPYFMSIHDERIEREHIKITDIYGFYKNFLNLI